MLKLVETGDDVGEFMRWLSEQPFVAFDTETTGLYHFDRNFETRLIQFGSPDAAWVFHFQKWKGLVQDVFTRFDGQIVAHNAGYDVTALNVAGIRVPWSKIDDTMIALRLAEPTESAALKKAAGRLVSSAAATSQTDLTKAMRKNKWDWATVPIDFPPYVFYAAMDAVLTARLYETPTVRMGMASEVYKLEMAVKSITTHMEQTGMKIDTDFCDATEYALRDEAEELKMIANRDYGVSLTSTAQIGRFLLASDAAPLMTKSTAGGGVSVDKEVLEPVSRLDSPAGELARMVMRVRKVEKIASAYFDNFLARSDINHVVHAQIETLAARTGRMSIRNPALQTLPKPSSDPESRLVRRAIIPRHEGDKLVTVDMDQIELRLAASLSGDDNLIQAFKTADSGGADFFTSSARSVYEDSSLDKGDDRRSVIKSFWYSALYGAGVEKMAMTAGVSKDRMKVIRDGIATQYPRFFELMKVCELEARETGSITTPYGRRLPVNRDKAYTATNYRIQGAAADVLKQSIVNMAQAGLEDYMLVPVHDEIVLSIPEDEVEELRPLIKASMENFDFAVPLTADPSHGADTWAEAK